MHLDIMDLPPGGPAVTLACAILAAQADRLDRMNADVTDELGRYAQSRARIADLIEILVDGLDDLDEDADLEPYLTGFAGDDREGGGEGGGFYADEDFEPPLGWTDREAALGGYAPLTAGEDEPTLGARESHHGWSQYGWSPMTTRPADDEREEENEHRDPLDEGELDTSDDEHSLCGLTVQSGEDREQDLASTSAEDGYASAARHGDSDAEPALGAPEPFLGFGSENRLVGFALNRQPGSQLAWADGGTADLEEADDRELDRHEDEVHPGDVRGFAGSGVDLARTLLKGAAR